MLDTDSSDPKMTLDAFPPEVLATIFNYLSEHQIKRVSDVNRRWRDIASSWVLAPRGHLLLHHAPLGAAHTLSHTPPHTLHIDGDLPLHHHHPHHHLAHVHTVVLYGTWTRQNLVHLSHLLALLPDLVTLEICEASPPHVILDFLLVRHDVTRVRCFLGERQSKPFRKVRDALAKTHGLFEEALLTQRTADGLQVYAPKARSLAYPEMEKTSNLIIHPARLSQDDFDSISGFSLKSLTLNYPKNMPAEFLTTLSPRLRELNLLNAQRVSHDSWIDFFKSPAVHALERLRISGHNQIDSSIFDNLAKNRNLRKLCVQLHSPCAEHCGIKSMLSWCPNIEVLVLCVPFSAVGLNDLLNIDAADVSNLQTLRVLFQLSPDLVERMSAERLSVAQRVRDRLPGVAVDVLFNTHMREFLLDDDDFE